MNPIQLRSLGQSRTLELSRTLGRRGVLRGLGGIAMVPTFLQSMAAYGAAADNTILVCILLAGGNDGLNTVIPLPHYRAYAKLRTPAPPPQQLALAYTREALAATAFDADVATPAASASSYAFAPSMGAMRALYATGRLAVINGIGLPKAELDPLSHSNAQTDWLTGQINAEEGATSGWLGLTLDHARAGPLGPVASLGGFTPLINGRDSTGLVVNAPIDYFGVSLGGSDDYEGLKRAFRQITVLPAASAAGTFDKSQLDQAVDAAADIKKAAHMERALDYPTPSWLDTQLRDIGRLIAAGSGIRGFYAVQGSYDTHSAQIQSHPLLLGQLSNAIAQFYAYLQGKGLSRNVVVMTMSDFGRRPFANQDFGTDHGGATTSFVFGDRVTGGVYGEYPSLTRFDANGNLAMNVDFRNVLSDLIGAMGGNPAPILGQAWPRLGFV